MRSKSTGVAKDYQIKSATNNHAVYALRQTMPGDTVTFRGKLENNPKDFKVGLSSREIKKRTSPETFTEIKLLGVDSPEFAQLADGDKAAAAHLTRAAYAMEDVYEKQDNPLNIPFREEMKRRTAKGDKNAEGILKLYQAQKGIIARDRNAEQVILLKGQKAPLGAGFWHTKKTPDEVKQVIYDMLDNGEDEEVKKLLSPRTVVKEDGKKLKAVDYTEEYKKEFSQAANEIEEASKVSTNTDFSEFLKHQAEALRKPDPKLDAKADAKWWTLQDTPLEFTITRESYQDYMTQALMDDEKFAKKMDEKGIKVNPKDSLGVRVGIVNKKGTAELLEMKKYLPMMANNMPFNNEYVQNINKEVKQSMVDVDLIAVTGDVGKYRAGITIAENLPNDDKLSVIQGEGKRNVFHRDIRQSYGSKKGIENTKQLLAEDVQPYYNEAADQWHTEIHENTHSCGPKRTESHLGSAASIIEEGKADMGLDVTGKLVEAGKYTKEEEKQLYTTFVTGLVKQNKRMPSMQQAHRVRAVMQLKHYMDEGAITVEKRRKGLMGLFRPEGYMKIDLDKMKTATRSFLEKIIRIQVDDKASEAQALIKEKFVWTKDIELLARTQRRVNKTLNGYVTAPLAEHLLKHLK